jgi:hypothetical protein
MPHRRAKSTARELAASNTVVVGGALAVAVGTLVGIASNNPVLAGISLSIGAGGLIGWLLAGSPAHNRRNGQ